MTESHAAALTVLKADNEQAEAWRRAEEKAVEKNQPVTAKIVREAVKEVQAAGRGDENDAAEESNPEPTAEALVLAEANRLESFADWIVSAANELPEAVWLDDHDTQKIRSRLQEAANTIRSAKADEVCPKCNGSGCDECRNTGYMPKSVFDEHSNA